MSSIVTMRSARVVCSLAEQSDDMICLVGAALANVLQPRDVVALAATCRGVLESLDDLLAEERRVFCMVRDMCHDCGMTVDQIGPTPNFKLVNYEIGEDCMKAFTSAIARGAKLEKLWLKNNKIGDAGMIAFAGAIGTRPLASLTVLGLAGNKFGDVGMKSFSEAIGKGSLPNLQKLWLKNNKIGDAGIIAFAGAIGTRPLASLAVLGLQGNKFSDVGMKSFSDAIGSLPKLEELGLPYTIAENKFCEDCMKALMGGALPVLKQITIS